MTPQEKAKELVEKMEGEVPFTTSASAVQCALILANEMLDFINSHYWEWYGWDEDKQFWINTKTEIEKL